MKKLKRNKRPDPDMDNILPILVHQWRRINNIKGGGPESVLQTREFRQFSHMVRHLCNPQGKGEAPFPKEADALGVEMLYEWVIRYHEGLHLIAELPKPPKKVLDLCSGLGAFSFAALHSGASAVTAVDKRERALHLAGKICGKYGYPIEVAQKDVLRPDFRVEEKYDLIIIAHSLEELFPTTEAGWAGKQLAFVSKFLKNLTEDGHLLIVGSSWPQENRNLLVLRDKLVNKGIPVQAPCVWQGECPALRNDKGFCYAQREYDQPKFIKEVHRGSGIRMNSLKMSYLICGHPDAAWPLNEEEEPSYRVISPLVETAHGKRHHLCGTDGNKTLGSRLMETPEGARAFDYLKRGDLIQIEDAQKDQHRLTIIEDTTVRIKAACGKPVSQEY